MGLPASFLMGVRPRVMRWLTLAAVLLVSACAQLPRSSPRPSDVWTGRLSLIIQTEPPQSFYAGFELRGNASQGELDLNSPLGNTVVAARWAPGQASLESGGKTQQFASIDELIARATGSAVPVAGLFDWLAGKNTALNGWAADLSEHAAGRINAKRNSPAPASELRIVFSP